ncbi:MULTISPECIES: hypothetical protein [Campylobacter]|uniref:hypothetical protein n=1 Tax=Campylobacter TaxID=194 RepID=UPI000A32C667|nr:MULTISPECIES: hypothetical protein [unclassified Campylobacter]MBE6430425.1 hypothetical protein [Campylobacter sp.]
MARYGQTANGLAHFAPMMRLEAPQLDIGNPFKDYIAQAIAERELELKEKGLGLDEQKLAYIAANDEADRDLARELAGQKAKDAKDLLKLEYSHKNSMYNRAKAEEDLRQKEANEYYGFLVGLADQGMDITNPKFFQVAREYARDSGNTGIVNFFTNQGAKAADLNNLFLENEIKNDVVGQTMRDSSRNGKPVTTHRSYE